MKIIAKCIGGSHLYGLNTPESDIDYRFIFLNTDISDIIGLTRHEHQTGAIENDKVKDENDSSGWELRRALNLLKKGNTQILELLFLDNYINSNSWITILPEWKLIQSHAKKLIDTNNVYKSLKGYIHSERKLANGERTGALGGKRKENIEKYGYSPKNFTQLLRLSWAGHKFFQFGFFPPQVDYSKLNTLLKDIKLNPQNYNKEQLNELSLEKEKELDWSFENRRIDYKFDEDLANNLILQIYLPLLKI